MKTGMVPIKFITIDIDILTSNLTDTSLDIMSVEDIVGANVIISDDILRNTILTNG
jgi:hypothetical protein